MAGNAWSGGVSTGFAAKGPQRGEAFNVLPKKSSKQQLLSIPQTFSKTSEPITSRAQEYKSPGENRSPAGETIPAGIGTNSYDGKIVFFSGFTSTASTQQSTSWIQTLLNGFGSSPTTSPTTLPICTFAVLFADCLLTPSFSLVKLYADNQLIWSNVAPARSPSQTIRFYDGTQTTPDPALVAILGADQVSAWPGYCYAVFDKFDVSAYGNRVPLIRVVVSGSVTESDASEELSTLTFGAIDPSYENNWVTVDRAKNHAYVFYWADLDDGYVSVVDIRTNAEISRSRITETNYTLFEYMVALDGTDYFVCTGFATPANPPRWYELMLVNAYTGEVVARSYPYTQPRPSDGEEVVFEAIPHTAVLIENGAATKFLLMTSSIFSGLADCVFNGAVIVDVTNGTFTWVAHPYLTPLPGPTGLSGTIAVGPVEDGVATIFYAVSFPNAEIWKAQISATAFTAERLVAVTTTYIQHYGLAYGPADNNLLFYESNGLTGAILRNYDADTGLLLSSTTSVPIGLVLNYANSSYGSQTQSRPQVGFTIAFKDNVTYGGVYEVALDGSNIQLLLDPALYTNDGLHAYYDHLTGVYIEDSALPGQIWKITPGDSTPNQVDAEDVFKQLAQFRDRFELADLSFTGFPGNECQGIKVINDTTIEDLELNFANAFDVKIVASDGLRKYIWPPRDGSFATDHTLEDEDILERGTVQITKTMNAGEDELLGVTFGYFDQNVDYRSLEQPYDRPVGVFDVTPSTKHRSITPLIAMTGAQAVQAAMLLTFRSVYGNNVESLSVRPGKSHIEPADLVLFDFRGFNTVGRVKEARFNANFTQELVLDEYLQFVEAVYEGSTIITPDLVDISTSVRLILLNVPLLSPFHDTDGESLVQYYQLVGLGTASLGTAALYRSSDNGDTWLLVGEISAVSPVAGVVTALYGSPSDPFEVDETSTIELLITSGNAADLESITDDEFEAGANVAAIGAPGRWVLVYFKNVSVSSQSVVLSHLLWGVRGTEVWIDDLAVGDTFVMINEDHYIRSTIDVDAFGDVYLYKAVTAEQTLGDVQTYTLTNTGVGETPYAPVNLVAEYHPLGIRLSWDYRSRIEDGLDPTEFGEVTLEFEVEIMDGSSVKRLFQVSGVDYVIWTDAQIATDFGSLPSSWVWRVYMMSDVVGRGHMAEQTSAQNSGVILLAGDEQSGTDRVLVVEDPGFELREDGDKELREDGDDELRESVDVEAFTEITNG